MRPIALPELHPEHEPTRATLHAYARAVGAAPRAHGIAHPKWWHISLKVRPEGLATDPIPIPGGGSVALRMDLHRHLISIRSSRGAGSIFDMREGATGTEMGDRLITALAELGLEGGYDRGRFENDEPRSYNPAAAEAFFAAFVDVQTVFEHHRASLGDRVGPIQVWPHGFDLAFEWFGARLVEGEEGVAPAQLNLGFYPATEPYFYSNPWPFDEALLGTPLPGGAVWQTQGWQGAMLSYQALQGDPEAARKLAEFARAVFDAASPTLELP